MESLVAHDGDRACRLAIGITGNAQDARFVDLPLSSTPTASGAPGRAVRSIGIARRHRRCHQCGGL